MPRELVGGSRLVGRQYYLRDREIEILIGWGPGATVRNVAIRFRDTGETTIRPFRGLTLRPRGAPNLGQHKARVRGPDPDAKRGLRPSS